MKRFNLFLLGLAAMGLTFTSCESDTEAVGPTISFIAGEGLITENATINVGETASFSWLVKKGDANLSEFTIRIDNQDVDGFPNMDLNRDQYEDTFDTTLTEAGDYTFAFIAEDKDGLKDTKSITVTVTEAPVNLLEFNVVLLGAQSSAEPSCASLETGVRYGISGDEAKNNSDKVDIVHYNGAKDVALYAPSNADIQGVSAYAIDTWATKNATLLSETSLTSAEFDAITTNVDLGSAGTPSEDVVGLLTVDKVVVFETASGKKGVFQVTDLTDAADGSVTIHVKVEE